MSEDRLKIAVFIDFDNIEIGVRNTLNRNFDIAAVLEAIKERGEIVTKVAYGDWKRSGEYGRAMGQHAIHMVQRNPTPGGDKNGADINLALDALEMAFTRDHINAFVIVGGDSDFMTLVEKLKQYDKKVFVVGGRAFTSVILQKNCHEFIAYENLIRPVRRPTGRARTGVDREAGLEKAVPLVLRALKILTDREVSPQIGLLKSTLLQLDSTFSERDYGASTFRGFVEKLEKAGVISLKHVDRSIVVEPIENGSAERVEEDKIDAETRDVPPRSEDVQPADVQPVDVQSLAPMNPERIEEGVRRIREAFEKTETPPKWPMYLRGVKQLIKAVDPEFDELAYGFRGLQDALRHVQRTGLLRLDRNRKGVLRILPGDKFPEMDGATRSATRANSAETDDEPELAQGELEAVEPVAELSGPSDDPDGPEETAARKTARKTPRKKTGTRATRKTPAARTTRKKSTGTRTRKTAAGKAQETSEGMPAPD